MAENVGAIEYTVEAKTGKAVADLKKVEQQNSKLGRSFGNADKRVGTFNATLGKLGGSFSRLTVAVSSALGPVGMFAAAVTAATAAAAQMVATTASQIKQIDVLAERANMNASAFQALAHASKTVNVDMDQLSQTIQDVNDRVGEFAGEGTGELAYAFERFLKPAGYTIEALREMGGRDVLQALATEMERAGASGNEMTAVFEQVASNASYLLPLLKDNGDALNRLSKEANDMGLIISNENVEQAKEFDRQWKLLGGQVTNFKNIIAIGATPAIQEFVSWAQAGVKWLDRLFNVSRTAQISNLESDIDDLQSAIDDRIARGAKKYGDVSLVDALFPMFADDTGNTEQMKTRLAGMKAELKSLLDEQQAISDQIANPARAGAGPVSTYQAFTMPKSSITASSAPKQQGSSFGGFGLASESDVMGDGAFATGFSQALIAENETITEQLQNQRDMIKMFQEMEIGDAQTHADALIAIDKQIAEEKMKTDQAMLSASGDFFGGMADLVGNFAGEQSNAYKALFAVSKGFAIANAALQMQTAIANAMALPWPTNLGAIGQAVSLGGQIASTIGSLSYGGGRATGGPVDGNSFYQMGEGNRPEVLQTGAGMFVAPGDKGRVFNGSQLEQINGSGNKPVINIYTSPGTDASVTENSDGSTDIVIQKIVEQFDNKSGPVYDSLMRNTDTKARL
jgi:hypothetical protein